MVLSPVPVLVRPPVVVNLRSQLLGSLFAEARLDSVEPPMIRDAVEQKKLHDIFSLPPRSRRGEITLHFLRIPSSPDERELLSMTAFSRWIEEVWQESGLRPARLDSFLKLAGDKPTLQEGLQIVNCANPIQAEWSPKDNPNFSCLNGKPGERKFRLMTFVEIVHQPKQPGPKRPPLVVLFERR